MTTPLMELIGHGEGDYNSYNRGTGLDAKGKTIVIPADKVIDFSQITLAEIQRRQRLPKDDPDYVSAVGKYQFIRSTLDDGVSKLELNALEKFTPELQDRLFNEYLLPHKRPQIKAYIAGQAGASLHDAQKATCMEWASVEDPDTPGHVYAKYEKYGNKMHTTSAQVAVVLDEMRAEYKAQIDLGLSPEEAWRATTNMGPGQFQHIAKAQTTHRQVTGNVLSEGAHGPTVAELQKHLNNLGYTDSQGRSLTIDQDFGRNTRHAVEAFQRDLNLQVDGVAGPRTWAALREASRTLSAHAASPESSQVTFPQMAPPDLDTIAIRTLQQHLNTLQATDHRGHQLPITGAYDEATRSAVSAFQQAQGLPDTGIADPATCGLIEARATIAQLQQSASMRMGPRHHDAGSPQDTLTIMQAQLQDMQRQMEAMTRQREQEREKDKTQDDSRDVSNEPARDPARRARSEEASVSGEPLSYSNPQHPQHELYARLKELLPPGTSEARLAQSTAACYMGRITQPEQLHEIHIVKGAVHFLTTRPDAHASIDMTQPAPTVRQSMQQVQTYEQQQTQMWAQFQAQQVHAQHGPVMRGPMLH